VGVELSSANQEVKIMRNKVVLLSIALLVSISAFALTTLFSTNQADVEASAILTSASETLVIPKPGQIAHYTYKLYSRGPNAGLEPSDPFHLSYSDIWIEQTIEDTWLEISIEGKTIRWRTQLHSSDRKLLQDLLFDGIVETDYFPRSGQILTITTTEVADFIDNRVALIDDFLNNDNQLTHRESHLPDGSPAIGIYLKPKTLQGSDDILAALLGFQNPFMADLAPVSYGSRIDIDLVSRVPIGMAQVVFDSSGQEHIVAYRTLSDPELLDTKDPRQNELFTMASATTSIEPPVASDKMLVNLSDILAVTDHPIYGWLNGTEGFQLAAADYTKLSDDNAPPLDFQAIQFASTWGAGIRMTYTKLSPGEPSTITVVQGLRERMTRSLQATRPMWSTASKSNFGVGKQVFPGWVMSTGAHRPSWLIIEMPQTLIYLEASGVDDVQLRLLLSHMTTMEK
jgi:hypothetical protein